MFKVEKRISLDSKRDVSVIKIYPISDKYFIVLDNRCKLYLFDNELKKITREIVLISKTRKFEFFKGISAFDKDLALAVGNNIVIYELMPRVSKKRVLDWHSSKVEILKYSNTEKFLISAENSGRVFLYNTENYQVDFYMPKRKDFSYSLEFSSNDRFLLLSYYDRVSILFDMVTYQFYDTFETSDLVELSIFFDNNKKIFIILRGGDSFVYDIFTKELKFNYKFPMNLIGSYHFIDNRYLVFSNRDNRLMIYDLLEFKIVLDRLHDFLISYIHSDKNYIYLGGRNFIDLIDINHKLDEANMHLMVKDYKKASYCSKKNIFLNFNTKYSEAMKIGWEEYLPKMVEHINNKELSEAQNLAMTFNKLEEVENYMQKSFIMKKFNLAVSSGNLKNCYTLISSSPFLKETKEYSELEKYWLKMFLLSKKIMNTKSSGNIRKLLKPFLEIDGKKEIIDIMLKKPKLLSMADTFALTRDYENFFALIKENPFLKESDAYKRVLANGYTFYEKFNKFFDEMDIEKAKRVSGFLVFFEDYKDDVRKKLKIMENLFLVKEYLKEKNYIDVFEVLSRRDSLFYEDYFDFLINDLDDFFEELYEDINSGKPKVVKSKIEQFFGVERLKYRLEFTMKLSYINELNRALKFHKDKVDLPKSVSKFLNIFGADIMLLYTLTKQKIKIKIPSTLKDKEENLEPIIENYNYLSTILEKKVTKIKTK